MHLKNWPTSQRTFWMRYKFLFTLYFLLVDTSMPQLLRGTQHVVRMPLGVLVKVYFVYYLERHISKSVARRFNVCGSTKHAQTCDFKAVIRNGVNLINFV